MLTSARRRGGLEASWMVAKTAPSSRNTRWKLIDRKNFFLRVIQQFFMWLLFLWCHFSLFFRFFLFKRAFQPRFLFFKILYPPFSRALGYETFLSYFLVRFWCQAFICALFRAFGFRGVVLPAFSLLSCRPFWKLGVNGSFSVGRLTVRILFRNGRGYHFGCFELSIKIMAKTAVLISGSGGSSSTFHLWFGGSPSFCLFWTFD